MNVHVRSKLYISHNEELKKKLQLYKATNYVEFWKRDARTIAAACPRMPDRPMKGDLQY